MRFAPKLRCSSGSSCPCGASASSAAPAAGITQVLGQKKAPAGPGLGGSSGAVLLAGQQHLSLVQGLLFGGLLADEMEDVHHSPDSAPAPVA